MDGKLFFIHAQKLEFVSCLFVELKCHVILAIAFYIEICHIRIKGTSLLAKLRRGL